MLTVIFDFFRILRTFLRFAQNEPFRLAIITISGHRKKPLDFSNGIQQIFNFCVTFRGVFYGKYPYTFVLGAITKVYVE